MGMQPSSTAGRTPRENLAYLAEAGCNDATLKKCAGLAGMVLAALDVSGTIRPDGRPVLLLQVLDGVAEAGRDEALEKIHQKMVSRQQSARENCCQIAAAAELLERGNDKTLESLLEYRCSTGKEKIKLPDVSLDKKLSYLVKKAERKRTGRAALLQTRAAAWLGSVNYKTGQRWQPECFDAFEAAIPRYLAEAVDGDTDASRKKKQQCEELRGLAVKLLEPLPTDAAILETAQSENPPPPTPHASAPPSAPTPDLTVATPPPVSTTRPRRKRLLLSLGTALVVTVGSLGLWWQWPTKEAEAMPLNVNATWPVFRGCDGGTTVAMQPGGADIHSFGVSKTEDVRPKIATAPGGGSWRSGQLVIDLSGKTDEPVEISNIHHKKLRELPAPKWVYEPRGGCGGAYYRNFVLDLDEGRLFDKGVVGGGAADGEKAPPTELIGPAFTVSRRDPAQITVDALSCKGNYEWELIIDYVQGGKSGRLTLGPYRSMGVARNTERYFSADGTTYESDGKFSGSEPNWCKQILDET